MLVLSEEFIYPVSKGSSDTLDGSGLLHIHRVETLLGGPFDTCLLLTETLDVSDYKADRRTNVGRG